MRQNFLEKFYHKENFSNFLCPKIHRFFGNHYLKMKQKSILFLILGLLILSLFLISLISSQQNSTPLGTPSPNVGSGIDASTGLPIDVLPIKNIGDTLSDADRRTAYLKAEWQKILEKSEIFGPWVKFLEKLNPVSNILLGMPIVFSWFFFLTLAIWIAFIVIIFRITALFEITNKWLHVLIALAIIAIITYLQQPKSIAAFIIGIIALMSVWWMQYVIIGIVILAIILATYFSKQLELVGKWIKERNEKNIEQLKKEKFEKNMEAVDELRKTITK